MKAIINALGRSTVTTLGLTLVVTIGIIGIFDQFILPGIKSNNTQEMSSPQVDDAYSLPKQSASTNFLQLLDDMDVSLMSMVETQSQ